MPGRQPRRQMLDCWQLRSFGPLAESLVDHADVNRFVTSSAETPIVCVARSIVGADSGVRSRKAGQRPRRNGLLRTYRRQLDRQTSQPLASPEAKSDHVRPAEGRQSCVAQLSLIEQLDQHLVVLLRGRLASVNAGPPGTRTP
jgi:hypothetical protein